MSDKNTKIVEMLLNHTDTCEVKVRFNDTDAMGIVHFMNYMMYFDDGFVSFMNSLDAPRRVEDLIYEGIALGVKHIDITYENPAKFGDFIIIITNIEKLGNKSMTFLHELYRKSDNALLAVVKAVRFAMDLKSKSLRDISEFFKYFLSK